MMNVPDFWGFLCSYAHNLLIYYQQNPKDNFSSKNYILDQVMFSSPLKETIPQKMAKF